MVHQGDSDTYISFGTDLYQFVAGGVDLFRITNNSSTQRVDVNPLSQNVDFQINGTFGNARAFVYDSGTDTLESNASNFIGIADQETGTWTPVFNGGGTEGVTTATYSRVGDTVTVKLAMFLGAGTASSSLSISSSSLPYTVADTANTINNTDGTWFTCPLIFGRPNFAAATDSGVMLQTNTFNYFMKSDSTLLNTLEITDYLGFSITYITDE